MEPAGSPQPADRKNKRLSHDSLLFPRCRSRCLYVYLAARAASVCRICSGRPEKISEVGGSNGAENGTRIRSFNSADRDYSKAKASSCETAAANGGGCEGIPRWSRILRLTSGARMVVRMRSLPPQCLQAKTSAANTRFMSSDAHEHMAPCKPVGILLSSRDKNLRATDGKNLFGPRLLCRVCRVFADYSAAQVLLRWPLTQDGFGCWFC